MHVNTMREFFAPVERHNSVYRVHAGAGSISGHRGMGVRRSKNFWGAFVGTDFDLTCIADRGRERWDAIWY